MNKNKIIALTIAASMLLGSTALAQPLADEGSLKAVPVSIGLKQNKEMTAYIFNRTVYEQNEYIKATGKLPLILGMKSWKHQMDLNNLLRNQAMKDIETVEEEIKKQTEAAKENGWPLRQGEVTIEYEVKTNNDILSFVIKTYMYLGGANGTTRVDTYNIDLKNNQNINLSDLFNNGSDYKTVINNEILTQMESRTKEGEMFFEGDMGFKTITDNHKYYIQDDNLVIQFQKYDIAPGAMGPVEFKIPLSSLNQILKADFAKYEKPQDGKKQVAFKAFTGTVKEINLRTDNGLKYVSVENESGETAVIVISKDTYVVDNAEIKAGAVITGFYDATAPMIMIYPPQYNAEVVALVEKGKNIKVDRFDENLLSSDLWLKLNISKDTEIITEDGKAFKGNLKNRDLVVFYGATTKSIPPQTTPTKIVVLSDKDNK